MSNDWLQLPTIELPSPVLALLATPDGVWAGGLGGVALSSADRSWTPAGMGLALGSVATLSAAEGVIFAGGEGGLARSVDGGRSWLACLLPDNSGIVSAVALSPRFLDDQTALAATLDDGILRSIDAGRTWQRSSFGLDSREVLAIAWGTGENVIVATASGLFQSPNAGRAWRPIEATAGVAFVTMATMLDGEMLVAPATGPLLRSSLALTRWSPLDGLPADIQTSSILVVNHETMLCGTAGHGLLRSTDGGLSWTEVSPEHVLALVAVDQRIYAGMDRGVLLSQDGGFTWEGWPPPPLHDLHRLAIVGGVPLVSGRNSPPVILGPDGTWTVLHSAPLPQSGLFVTPGGALMAATTDGLFRSEDLGSTWTLVVAGNAGCVTQMTFADREQGWAGGGGTTRLLRTGDGGQSWNELPAPFGVLPLGALQAVPGPPKRAAVSLIATTYDERRHTVSLWRSDDGGQHWVRGADTVTNWPVVATCDTPLVVTIGSTITARQPDGTWQQAVVGDAGIRRVVSNGRLLLALAGDGLWRSDDLGSSWERDDLDLPIEETIDIALDMDTLYVLLAGGRLWSRGLE